VGDFGDEGVGGEDEVGEEGGEKKEGGGEAEIFVGDELPPESVA
jgi:hypothetical protein